MEKEASSNLHYQQALTLGKFWHDLKGTMPENFSNRVGLAINLSTKDLSKENRVTMSVLIRKLAQDNLGELADAQDFNILLARFESGEVTLEELLKYELNVIETNDLSPEIKEEIAEINDLVYRVLKGIHGGESRADSLNKLDEAIDDTRNEDFETAVKAILKRVVEDLEGLSKLKEVRLTHVNPNPDIREHQVHSISHDESEIDEHTNIHLFDWKEKKYSNLIVNWSKVMDPENNEMRLIFKLSFGDLEFGYLEYRFEGGKVHPLVFDKCANISSAIDSFLNARLQDEVKKIIAERKRTILAEHNFKDWTLMCTQLCSLLSKVLKKPIAFSCNLKPGQKKSWDVLVDGDKTEEDADFVGFTAESLKEGGEFFELEIDQGKGRQRIGSIMVACSDDSQRGIVKDALSFMEGIIMGREEARHWLSKLIGAPSADMWLANEIEKTPKIHPAVVLYADIDDYSKTVRELEDTHPAAVGGIDEIMNRFISDAKLTIEKKFNVVVDKFVGDEAIVLIGPPYTEDGLDAFGKKEANFANYMDLAFDISEELQQILDKISTDVQTEYNFALPRRLIFQNGCGILKGSPIGIYGSPEKPGAGVDYTAFGNEMNQVARVLSKADAGEFLMPHESYLKYLEHGGEKLKPVGEPFEVTTHGVGKFTVILVEKATQEA